MTEEPALTTKPLALFPLPATVFYPATFLPLHIFEPRYRKMVVDAWREHPFIGMVLLKPGWEDHYLGNPPIQTIGCAGRMEHMEPLAEGKFNILLQGLSRFRIVTEFPGEPYRRAEIELLQNVNDQTFTAHHPLADKLTHYLSLLPAEQRDKIHFKPQDSHTLGETADGIIHLFEQPVERKQAFLEELDAQKRAHIVDDLLDLKIGIIRAAKQRRGNFDVRRN
jgi:hypothetical protein